MIRFTHRCGYVFEVPDELAATSIQCPQCGLLVDVPGADEIQELQDDGTYRTSEDIPLAKGVDYRKVYQASRVDRQGQEIDLRQTLEELQSAGTQEPAAHEELVLDHPKYDPETGELIRPIPILPDPDFAPPLNANEVPMAAMTLNYAPSAIPGGTKPAIVVPFFQLFKPVNLIVILSLLLVHPLQMMMLFSLYIGLVLLMICTVGVFAHYANVIEEVGVQEQDELPTFLRHVDLGEDIWFPFLRVASALIASYLPVVLVAIFLHSAGATPQGRSAYNSTILAVMGLGTFLFPAILLTTVTSGSPENLRPDRLFGVIQIIGWRYLVYVAVFAVALPLYFFPALYALGIAGDLLFHGTITPIKLFGIKLGAIGVLEVTFGSLLVGIFLMHYFAMLLGLAYRSLHELFPWVYQRFSKDLPGVTTARSRRYRNDPPIRAM